MADILRTFIAIEMDGAVKARLKEARDILREHAGHVKWVDPESAAHLTLYFMGETHADIVDAVVDSIAKACCSFEPFSFKVCGLGAFGGRRPRVLWCGVLEKAGILEKLHEDVVRSLEGFGFPDNRRSFNPHLTLGRIRRPVSAPGLLDTLAANSDFDAGQMLADHLTLFKSTLTPTGALYEPLAELSLGGKT